MEMTKDENKSPCKRKVEPDETAEETGDHEEEMNKAKKLKTCDSERTSGTNKLSYSQETSSSLRHNSDNKPDAKINERSAESTVGFQDVSVEGASSSLSQSYSVDSEGALAVSDSHVQNGTPKTGWSKYQKAKKGMADYILQFNLQVKLTGSVIKLEAYYHSGSAGKDGLNQMLQFMRNQLTNPTL